MKIDANEMNKELQQKVNEVLANTEDKNEGVYEAISLIVEAKNADLVKEIQEEAERAASDSEYRKALNLRTLSQNEKNFYENFKNLKQAVTADQIGAIPNEIVDRTLADIKESSNVMSLVKMAPANVKLWVTGNHSGKAGWGALTAGITDELSAAITALQIDVHKLSAFLVIPKGIRDLGYEFVDQYFRAVLAEAFQDGLEAGFIDGDGKNGPIGILRSISTTNSDGTNKAKNVISTITGFSPKAIAAARKTLSNGGKRVISAYALICNPEDQAEYVDPALYGETRDGNYVNKSFLPLTVYPTTNCPQGKAILTAPGLYTMGLTGGTVMTYDQTKALEDADLMIVKAYGNGRADDDNTAVVFDVTKLEEFAPSVKVKGTVSTKAAA